MLFDPKQRSDANIGLTLLATAGVARIAHAFHDLRGGIGRVRVTGIG